MQVWYYRFKVRRRLKGSFSNASDDASASAAVTIFLWGIISFALISPLQTRVVNEASHAPNLASTLNQGAFNLGNAVGASIGGAGLTLGLAYSGLPWIGALLAALALLLATVAFRLEQRRAREERL